MPMTFYCASGSPYAWRVWLTLEYKAIPYELRMMSFDAGDLATAQYAAVNPRRRVPAIVDDGFALYESAAIVEYLDERYPGEPRVFPGDARQRALVRRMVREADQYFAEALERLVDQILFKPKPEWSQETIAAARATMASELASWERAIAGDFLAGPVSAADFTFYPELALAQRMQKRKPDLDLGAAIGPRLAAWLQRMSELPVVRKTWPPHWK